MSSTSSGEQFLKEIHRKYGKIESFNFSKGNFFQVCLNLFKFFIIKFVRLDFREFKQK